MLTLALFYAIKRLHCQVEVLLYADDIHLMIRGSGSRVWADIRAVMYELPVYSYFSGLRIKSSKGVLTRSHGGPATGRCGGHAQVSRQAKHYAHKGIITLVSCDKAFQDPCHSATRE